MANGSGDLTRRDFIKHTGVAGAGVALATVGCGQGGATTEAPAAQPPKQAVAAAPSPPADDTPMPKKALGKTGVEVPVLGAGTALNVTPILLNRALDAGVTYLDTAEGYGNGASERAIGKILAANGRRSECFIVSKTGTHNPATLEQHLNGTLERLQTDHVDLYYLHNLGDPNLLDEAMMKKAEELKKSGKIRFFGFSSHHDAMVPTMQRAAEVGFIDTIMFKYNFRDYNDAELNRVMDACKADNIGLVAMKTQGGAVTFADRVDPFEKAGLNRYQAVLRGVYEDQRIDVIVSAMKNVRQVEENSFAAKHQEMSLAEREALHEYRLASNHLYCRGCGHHCMTQMAADTNVPDVLRYLMYYENYGDRRQARELFKRLPEAQRAIRGVDFARAEAACPYGLAVGSMMQRAETLLA